MSHTNKLLCIFEKNNYAIDRSKQTQGFDLQVQPKYLTLKYYIVATPQVCVDLWLK